MKPLSYRNDVRHNGYTDLTAKDTDEMHESRQRSRVRHSCQGARFERLQNDAAYQPDVRAGKSTCQQQFHGLEASSRPRAVEVCTNPAPCRGGRKPNCEDQTWISTDDECCD